MNKRTDFNDLRDPIQIKKCIDDAQPVHDVADAPAGAAEVPASASPALASDIAPALMLVVDTHADTILRLAAMSRMEYDRVRKHEAKRLNIRQATLDAEVDDVRMAKHSARTFPMLHHGLAEHVPGDEVAATGGCDVGPDETAQHLSARSDGIPSNYIVTADGVFFRRQEPEKFGGGSMLRVCSELRITALVRDPASENWGRVLEFKDADDHPHQWVMPMAMLAGDGVDLRRELAQQGLDITSTPHARTHLAQYISSCNPQARGRCVQKTGWYQSVFVLPDRVLGGSVERVLFQSEKSTRQYAQAGTLEEWKHHVARLCAGNSRVMLATCAAFAGPLLHLVSQDSGGIHFVGPSSIGKTTLLGAGASVFGGPGYVQSWRATGNGLEGLCALHNDTLLVLDEMGEVDPKEAGSIAYMIGNGAGKTRSDRHGDARTKRTWRLLFLSSGEVGLGQHMTEGGKAVRAGQEVRLIDLVADAGAGHGVFEDLHGFENGSALSNALKDATGTYYGAAGLAFIDAVAANITTVPTQLKAAIKEFVSTYLPHGAAGQASRVCARFAIMAAAGELATTYGVTGWAPGSASDAMAACFQAWLDQRGGAGNSERDTILAHVRAYFEAHGDARFTDIVDPDRVTVNRAGFRKCGEAGQEFYVLPEAYKRDVCAGFHPRTVTKVLLEAGWLMAARDQKSLQKRSLPGLGETRVYVITARMWATVDAD